MNLRKKPKYEIDSYFKMFELRKDSVKVLKILQNLYSRDSVKKSLHYTEQKQFEINFENFLKDKGINTSGQKTNGTLS